MSVVFGFNQTPRDRRCLDPGCCTSQAFGPCGVWGCTGSNCKTRKTHFCHSCLTDDVDHRQCHCPNPVPDNQGRMPITWPPRPAPAQPARPAPAQPAPQRAGARVAVGDPNPARNASTGVGAYVVKKFSNEWYVLCHKRGRINPSPLLISSPGGRRETWQPTDLDALNAELNEETFNGQSRSTNVTWRLFGSNPTGTSRSYFAIDTDARTTHVAGARILGPDAAHANEVDTTFDFRGIPDTVLVQRSGHAWIKISSAIATTGAVRSAFVDVFLTTLRTLLATLPP